MTGKRRVLYWDACVFLAWIKNETCWPEEITKGIQQTVDEWRAGHIVIVTSAITMLEVLSSQMTNEHKDAFAKVFSDPDLQMVDVDRRVAGKASVIRSTHDTRVFKDDGSKVSGTIMSAGDSIHLATAIHYDEVDEFQTLDGSGKRKRAFNLLSLDGNIAGARLSIKLPKYVPPPEPLKGPVVTIGGAQPGLFDPAIQSEAPQAKAKPPEPEAKGGAGTVELAIDDRATTNEPNGHTNGESATVENPPTSADATVSSGDESGTTNAKEGAPNGGKHEESIAITPDLRGGGDGHPEGQAGTEAPEKAEGEQAGED